MKLKVNVEGVKSVTDYIDNYIKDLENKVNMLVKQLLAYGYEVAYESAQGDSHRFSERVRFDTEMIDKLSGELRGTGTPFDSYWVDADGGVHEDTVYPMLMLEFGSAGRALVKPKHLFGADASMVGYGSFSVRNVGRHTKWYYWQRADENGIPTDSKIATAEEAKRPMFYAMMAMQAEVLSIAMECFK